MQALDLLQQHVPRMLVQVVVMFDVSTLRFLEDGYICRILQEYVTIVISLYSIALSVRIICLYDEMYYFIRSIFLSCLPCWVCMCYIISSMSKRCLKCKLNVHNITQLVLSYLYMTYRLNMIIR